jgi:type VI secretion system protein ImpL
MRIRPWLLAALGLTAFGLLVWFAGPLLSIRGSAPLAGADVRIALIAVFVLQYLAQKGWSALRARRRNERVVEGLAPAASGAEPAEVAQLRKRFSAALATLRRTRFGARGGFWSSLSWKFGRQYLYQLPWYLIIGAPGAGKTTALLNSGLQFPLAGQFGRGSIKGIGGTRNCDWWFTDSAVLLDTAGRYTTHEADRVADRRAWEAFLALLRRARPRQPLNGALVAVSITDLLVFDPVQRAQHAATLRARLDEIRAAIGIRLPVYLLLTKCDLLPGFLDSFLAFDKRARDQVWGTTFDFAESNKGQAADKFPAAFEQLVERLHEDLIERIQAERDPQRRVRIYAFPRQFAGLGEPLNDLVHRTFGSGNSSPLGEAACLRGVYFTSGTQEGTPIDRALSALGRELGLERQILPPNQSTGKSFFLTSLLRDVVFAEAEIAGRSAGLQRWRSRVITATLALVQFAGVLIAANWLTDYTHTSSEVAQIASEAAAARAQVQATDARPGTDPRPLLPALNALHDLVRSTVPGGEARSALMSEFSRHQRLKLAAAAHQTYERMLLDSLLARIVLRCEEQLRSGADPNLQYEALKAYTMLHEPARFDAASLKAFVTYDWDTALEPSLSHDDRVQLLPHLDALLDAGATGAARIADSRLVESVRTRLAGQAVSQRIATRLKAILGARSYPEFTVASLGAAAAALFVGKDGLSAPRDVPGRFTLQAYRDGVLTALPSVALALANEATWVLAAPRPPASSAESSVAARSAAEALAAYLDDYVHHWVEFIDDVRLKRATGGDAIRQTQLLAARDGPLAALVKAVVQQTSLHQASASTALRDAAAPLEGLVEDRFASLHQFTLQGADGRRPLDAALADFNELQVLRALASSRTGSGDAANSPERLERIRADARRYPDPVRSILLALATLPAPAPPESVSSAAEPASIATASTPARARPTDAQLADACLQAVPGSFPFDRGSTREIAIGEFNRLFAPSGVFDSASIRLLGPQVGNAPDSWTLSDARPQAGLDDKTLARLRSAARIRDVFFAGRRADAVLRLTFRPHDMDETIDRFVLEIDGQSIRYAHGPPTATVITWPGPSPGARVEMTPPVEGQPPLEFSGTWALFRLLDRVPVESIAPGRFRVVFNLGGRRASFDVESESGANPFRMPELERFDCPSRS